jgi:SAM-dependent methyltransferase
MRSRNVVILSLVVLAALFLGGPSTRTAQEYHPTVGQEGKDVIWVPTPEGLVEKMLDMAEVTSADYLVDLGSGDGRTVIAAARRGARALGIEFNPDMVELSRNNARMAGLSGKANFVQGDIFKTDFSQATVVTMYLLSDLNRRLKPKLLGMKPGTRIVSHAFRMDDWEPDQSTMDSERAAFLWIVPVPVDGKWFFSRANGHAQLSLVQNYQRISGSLLLQGRELPLHETSLVGDRIEFSVDGQRYSGRVAGDEIEGSFTAGDLRLTWRAWR